MPIKFDIIHAVLIASFINNARLSHRNQAKRNKMFDDNVALCIALEQSQARVKYLANMLDSNEIHVDEFDLIILNDPIQS